MEVEIAALRFAPRNPNCER